MLRITSKIFSIIICFTCLCFAVSVSGALDSKEDVIEHMKIAKELGNFDIVQKVFNKAVISRIIDADIYNEYMLALGDAHKFDELQRVFRDMAKKGLFNDKTFVEYMIAAAKVSTDIDVLHETKRTFSEVRKLIERNVLYRNRIVAARESGDFDDAQQAFDEAIELEVDSPDTYGSYINTAKKADNFGEVKRAFYLARSKEIINASVYQGYILAVIEGGYIKEARKILNEAVDEKFFDDSTYAIYNEMLLGAEKESLGDHDEF